MQINIQDDPAIVEPIFRELKQNLKTRETHSIKYRKQALNNLLQGYQKLKPEFDQSLKRDLGLNAFMSNFLAHEITLGEIKDLRDNVQNWSQTKHIKTPITVGLASSSIQYQPLGLVLVISAWNYPIYTALPQVAAAISAGNSVILKPSELAPHTSKVLAKLFNNHLDNKYYRCVEGKVQIAKAISKFPFDMICFTGSTTTGRSIAIEAAKNLTPCLLELGGKCPVIVDESADINSAVLRIIFGKLTNCGQTCVGVDHVYLHQKIAQKFKTLLLQKLQQGYKLEEIRNNGDYAKIINQGHIERLQSYLNQNHGGQVLQEGIISKNDRFISPIVIQNPSNDSLLMNEQIFGPILPLKIYNNLDTVIEQINSRPKPLVVYAFSENKQNITKIKNSTSSGSFVVNDAIVQLLNPNLPFGGVGGSGYGRYHGVSGFESFSNPRSILETKAINWYPLSNRFAPYTDSKKKTMTFLLKLGSFNIDKAFRAVLIVAAGIGLFYGSKMMKPKL